MRPCRCFSCSCPFGFVFAWVFVFVSMVRGYQCPRSGAGSGDASIIARHLLSGLGARSLRDVFNMPLRGVGTRRHERASGRGLDVRRSTRRSVSFPRTQKLEVVGNQRQKSRSLESRSREGRKSRLPGRCRSHQCQPQLVCVRARRLRLRFRTAEAKLVVCVRVLCSGLGLED